MWTRYDAAALAKLDPATRGHYERCGRWSGRFLSVPSHCADTATGAAERFTARPPLPIPHDYEATPANATAGGCDCRK